MFCRSLFVLFLWPLCCLSFLDLRILITQLAFSNSCIPRWCVWSYNHNALLLHYIIIGFIWRERRKLSSRGWWFSSTDSISRWLTTWCSPNTKAMIILLYRNCSKMFKNLNVLFCWRQYNITESCWHGIDTKMYRCYPGKWDIDSHPPIIDHQWQYRCKQ